MTIPESIEAPPVSDGTVFGPPAIEPPGQGSAPGAIESERLAERKELHERTKRIQELMERIERLPNPAAKALLQDCLEALLSLYGEGLDRVMAILGEKGASGEQMLSRVLGDSWIRGLLLIHGLHPSSLEQRLKDALDQVRPYMQSHGGSVELISLQGDFARLRLSGSCKSCPSSQVTLELAVRKALEENCPDLAGFEVVGPA
jgi:Fe-S cluster biogenesis protein NfuA